MLCLATPVPRMHSSEAPRRQWPDREQSALPLHLRAARTRRPFLLEPSIGRCKHLRRYISICRYISTAIWDSRRSPIGCQLAMEGSAEAKVCPDVLVVGSVEVAGMSHCRTVIARISWLKHPLDATKRQCSNPYTGCQLSSSITGSASRAVFWLMRLPWPQLASWSWPPPLRPMKP